MSSLNYYEMRFCILKCSALYIPSLFLVKINLFLSYAFPSLENLSNTISQSEFLSPELRMK